MNIFEEANAAFLLMPKDVKDIFNLLDGAGKKSSIPLGYTGIILTIMVLQEERIRELEMRVINDVEE